MVTHRCKYDNVRGDLRHGKGEGRKVKGERFEDVHA